MPCDNSSPPEAIRITARSDGVRSIAAHSDDALQPASDVVQFAECKDASALVRKLIAAANRCRGRRQELSLLLAEPNVFDIHSDPQGEAACEQARHALGNACAALESNKVTPVSVSNERTAVILLDCERRGALAVANHAIAKIGKSAPRDCGDMATTLSIGVATMSVVPRNFDPDRLIDSASRCLSAARVCGISTVKSIEV